MPKNNKNKQKQNKNNSKQKQKKRSSNRTRRPLRRGNQLSKFAAMLADPCNAPLVPGIYGTNEGLLARMKSSFTIAESHGYVAWCPVYNSGATLSGYHHNFVVYSTNLGSNYGPANSSADPYGTTRTTSAAFIADPAYTFINGTTAADQRLIGSCLTLLYTGALQTMSGEVAYAPNVSTNVLLYGGAGSTTCTIDDLFVHATHSHRMTASNVEVKFHPGHNKPQFHRSRTGPLYYVTGTPTVTSPSVDSAGDPGWSVIAWRNVPTNSLRVIATKNFEWRPEANVGLTAVPPQVTGSELNYLSSVKLLDQALPNWWAMAGDSAMQALSHAAERTLGGSIDPNLIKRFGKMAMQLL